MALNLNVMMQKLDDANKETQSTGGKRKERDPRLWVPKPGENRIRILTSEDSPEDPFIRLDFLYDPCPEPKLSLLNFNEPDPIVEWALQTVEESNAISFDDTGKYTDDEKAESKRKYFSAINALGGKNNAKAGHAVPRYHCYMVDRADEALEPHFWAHSQSIWKAIIADAIRLAKALVDFNIVQSYDEVDFTDLVNGNDLIVTYMPPKKNERFVKKDYPDFDGPWSDNDYAKTTVEFENKGSVLTQDPEVAARLLSNQMKISEIFTAPTYDELKEDLDAYIVQEEQKKNRDTSKGIEVKYTNVPKPEEEEEPTVDSEQSEAVKSATDKFKNLFTPPQK